MRYSLWSAFGSDADQVDCFLLLRVDRWTVASRCSRLIGWLADVLRLVSLTLDAYLTVPFFLNELFFSSIRVNNEPTAHHFFKCVLLNACGLITVTCSVFLLGFFSRFFSFLIAHCRVRTSKLRRTTGQYDFSRASGCARMSSSQAMDWCYVAVPLVRQSQ